MHCTKDAVDIASCVEPAMDQGTAVGAGCRVDVGLAVAGRLRDHAWRFACLQYAVQWCAECSVHLAPASCTPSPTRCSGDGGGSFLSPSRRSADSTAPRSPKPSTTTTAMPRQRHHVVHESLGALARRAELLRWPSPALPRHRPSRPDRAAHFTHTSHTPCNVSQASRRLLCSSPRPSAAQTPTAPTTPITSTPLSNSLHHVRRYVQPKGKGRPSCKG